MTLALQLLPSPEVQAPGPAPPPAAGAFVQVLSGAVAGFCLEHGLDFDERALLEHLLDTAERAGGVVEGCTLTGLARDLGLGPSGRRTLAARLGRLEDARAIEWEPGSGSDAGRIEILVHHRLVRAGRGDHRVGYVQVLPAAVAAVADRHRLSASARALLRRLLVDVDHRSRSVTGSVRQLTARYRIGRDRLTTAVDELVAAGLVRRLVDGIHLSAYDQLVRAATVPAEPPGPRPDRAPAAPETRVPRVENARPSSPLDTRHQDLEPELVPEVRAPSAKSVQGEVGSSTIHGNDSALAALALALPVEAHYELLEDPAQAPGRQALRRRLGALVAELGESDAVASVVRDWPERVESPMALANNRTQRRLAESVNSSATAAGVSELAAQAAARRRRDALAGARNLGRNWAGAGVEVEDVAAQFADDDEAREAALAAFRAAAASERGALGDGDAEAPAVGRSDAARGRAARRWQEHHDGPEQVGASLGALVELMGTGVG